VNPLLWRAALGIFLATMTSAAMTLGVLGAHLNRRLEEFLRKTSAGHVRVLVEALDGVPEARLAPEVARVQRFYSYPVRLVRSDDAELPREITSARQTAPRVLARLPPRVGFLDRALARPLRREAMMYLPLRQGSWVLVLGPIQGPWATDGPPIFSALALSALVTLATALLLVVPLVRRLQHIEQAMVRFRGGDLSARSADTAADTLGSLSSNFDEMAARIQQMLEGHRHLFQALTS
jgi:methyl-accepting chemotaxis protein